MNNFMPMNLASQMEWTSSLKDTATAHPKRNR